MAEGSSEKTVIVVSLSWKDEQMEPFRQSVEAVMAQLCWLLGKRKREREGKRVECVLYVRGCRLTKLHAVPELRVGERLSADNGECFLLQSFI